MRALRNCDFCADDAVGAFEIVPPELEPTEAEQRRVVCCPDCRDRLEALLEPLLARAGAEVDAAVDAETDTGDRDHLDATADDSTATRSRTASSNATVSDGDADRSADPTGDEEPTRTEDEADAASSLEGGITFERDERDKRAIDETTPDGEPSDDDEPATATGAETADAADADDRSASTTESGDEDSPAASARPPAAYRKVIRLLRNREFPMKRSDVEGLAAGAYDLERHEVEAIVDHAVADGEFVEKRGKLRRP